MKDEVAQNLRKKYEAKKYNIKFYMELKGELKELEEHIKELPSVKRYMELIEIMEAFKLEDSKEWTNDEILKSVLRPWTLTDQMDYEDENGLWVCLGTYKYEIDRLVQTKRNDPKARFRKYLYLEANEDYTITLDISESLEFEKKHTIIFLKKNNSEEFYKLKQKYVRKAVLSSPKKAKKHILNATRKNRKI